MAELSRKDLEEAMYNALKRSGSGGGGFDAAAGTGTEGITNLNKAFREGKATLEGFKSQAEGSINTFRELSRSGSNFSNDLVGLSAAAYGSRLNLDDFSKIVVDNGKYLTGLGGSVTRGTEVFSKLSKSFFDSNFDTELRNLGYTSKELNEVLALQAGIQRTANSDTKESRESTISSAAALAKEMDLMAKLTGKSRQEQIEIMQKNKVDGQVEARLRLLTIGKTEEEAKRIKTEAAAALKQAEIEGRGQLAKEMFATGTVMSQTARDQAATFGAATTATAEQMEALRRGEFETARQYGDKATAEMLKNQQNTTMLIQATMGEAGGPIAQTMMKNIETMGPFNDAVQATAISMKNLLTTQEDYATAIKAAKAEIERSSLGVDSRRQQVGGSVAGITAIEKGMQDVKAGVAAAAVERDRQGKSIATEASRAGYITAEGARRLQGSEGNIAATMQARAGQGIRGEGGGFVGGVANAALTAATATVNLTGSTVLSITGEVQSKLSAQPVKSRLTGSLGTTGTLLEDFGQGTLAMLHGKEGVITEEQLKNLASGITDVSVSSTIESLKSSVDRIATTPENKRALPSVDLNSINLPNFGNSIRSSTATATQSLRPTTAVQNNTQTTTTESKANTAQNQTTQAVTRNSDASLNDVVKNLETLNKMMGQLITQSDDIGRRQITAVKSKSSNVYERF
jgi:hypothetical protein